MSTRHRPSSFRLPSGLRTLLLLAATIFLVVSTPGLAADKPPTHRAPAASELRQAKRLFSAGLKLYREGLYQEALSAFHGAKELAPRASIQRNIAQSYRDLRQLAKAYEAYEELLRDYGGTFSSKEKSQIRRALEELSFLTAEIEVTVREPGAAVLIDGIEVATTEVKRPLRVELGRHSVRVLKPGFVPLEYRVELEGGEKLRVRGPLEREMGVLLVTTHGDAAGTEHVWINGEHRGPTPLRVELEPGQVEIEVRGKTTARQTRKALVRLGEIVSVPLLVTPLPGLLRVDPGGPLALVAVDGKVVGIGAWFGEVDPGEHIVTVSGKGLRPLREVVTVTSGQTTTVDHLTATGEVATSDDSRGGALPWVGITTRVSLVAPFGVTSRSNTIAQDCPPAAIGSTRCIAGGDYGLGLTLNIGYSFGWFALEGFALISGARSTVDRETFGDAAPTSVGSGSLAGALSGSPRTEDYTFWRWGVGGGVAARATSKTSKLRFTGSIGGGFVSRWGSYTSVAEAAGQSGVEKSFFVSDQAQYFAPLLSADAGILIGSSPGTKVFLGVLMWVEFAPGSVPVPGGDQYLGSNPTTGTVDLSQGTIVSIGPVLGLQIGP